VSRHHKIKKLKRNGWLLVFLLNRQLNRPTFVIPDVIRDRATVWIPAFAGMTVIAVFICRINKSNQWIVNTRRSFLLLFGSVRLADYYSF